MQITCPKGCHLKGNFSVELILNGYEDGEYCNACGAEIVCFDPEAELRQLIYRLKRILFATASGMAMLASGVALTAWALS
jgi:hypothetical protein